MSRRMQLERSLRRVQRISRATRVGSVPLGDEVEHDLVERFTRGGLRVRVGEHERRRMLVAPCLRSVRFALEDAASVPIAKFVSVCGWLGTNFAIGTLANQVVLV